MVELTYGEYAIALWKSLPNNQEIDRKSHQVWQLEWAVVSEAWSEGRLIKGLQMTDWPLDVQRLSTGQKIESIGKRAS